MKALFVLFAMVVSFSTQDALAANTQSAQSSQQDLYATCTEIDAQQEDKKMIINFFNDPSMISGKYDPAVKRMTLVQNQPDKVRMYLARSGAFYFSSDDEGYAVKQIILGDDITGAKTARGETVFTARDDDPIIILGKKFNCVPLDEEGMTFGGDTFGN